MPKKPIMCLLITRNSFIRCSLKGTVFRTPQVIPDHWQVAPDHGIPPQAAPNALVA